MTTVVVDGSPGTTAMWDPLPVEPGRTEVLHLSSFAVRMTDGLDRTVSANRDWLADTEGRRKVDGGEAVAD
jgi:hypothetical protein